MSRLPRKLQVARETVRRLTREDLDQVAGGWIRHQISMSCPQPSDYASCRCVLEDQ